MHRNSSCPSAKMLARTTTCWPTQRLIGNRPPSTTGLTLSMTTRRRPRSGSMLSGSMLSGSDQATGPLPNLCPPVGQFCFNLICFNLNLHNNRSLKTYSRATPGNFRATTITTSCPPGPSAITFANRAGPVWHTPKQHIPAAPVAPRLDLVDNLLLLIACPDATAVPSQNCAATCAASGRCVRPAVQTFAQMSATPLP